MPSPNTSLAHRRADLESFMEWDYNRSGYIGYSLMPLTDVAKRAGEFSRITRNEAKQTGPPLERGSRSGYQRVDFEWTMDNYRTREYGLEGSVYDTEKEEYVDLLDYEMEVSERTLDMVLTQAEVRVAAATINNTSVASTAITTAWNDPFGKPNDDINAAKIRIRNKTGKVPNTVAMDWETWILMRENADLVDRVKYQGFLDARAETLTKSAVAQYFDVPQLLVAGENAVTNTANQGASAAVFAPIWSRGKVFIAVIAETSRRSEYCFGRTFHWGADGSQQGGRIEQYRDERHRADILRVRHDVEEHVYDVACAEILTAAIV